MSRVPLVYVLHSGKFFGTERTALMTLGEVRGHDEPWVLAPPGPAIDEARRRGMRTRAFASRMGLVRGLSEVLRGSRYVALCATAITHSLLAWALAQFHGTGLRHVHGGTEERAGYGRKRLLNHLPVRFVAVSAFVRERLLARRVRADRITVIENCTSLQNVVPTPRDGGLGARRVAIVSRVDPGRTGCFWRAGDARDLAARLVALSRLEPRAHRRVVGRALQQVATRFAPARMARAYRRVLARPTRPVPASLASGRARL